MLSVVCWCVLVVVCCLLFGVSCMLFVVRCVLFVVCCLTCVVAGCRVPFVVLSMFSYYLFCVCVFVLRVCYVLCFLVAV